MGRTPPKAVRQQLRREVNYGCPFPGCGDQFLTWHHFDPPWGKKKHQDPKGIIALCRKHHDAADQHLFSREQLRQWKYNPNTIEQVYATFPWLGPKWLMRFGGGVYGKDEFRIVILGKEILRVGPDADGNLTFSVVFEDATGAEWARIEENELVAETAAIEEMDIKARRHHLDLWTRGGLGIEVRFGRHRTEKLEEYLRQDDPPFGYRRRPIGDDLTCGYVDSMSCEEASKLGVTGVIRWHALQLRDPEDRLVPLLNLHRCQLRHRDRRVTMKDGRLHLEGGGTVGLVGQMNFGKEIRWSERQIIVG